MSRPTATLAPLSTLDHDQTRTAPGYEIVEVVDGWIAIAARTDAELAGALRRWPASTTSTWPPRRSAPVP